MKWLVVFLLMLAVLYGYVFYRMKRQESAMKLRVRTIASAAVHR